MLWYIIHWINSKWKICACGCFWYRVHTSRYIIFLIHVCSLHEYALCIVILFLQNDILIIFAVSTSFPASISNYSQLTINQGQFEHCFKLISKWWFYCKKKILLQISDSLGVLSLRLVAYSNPDGKTSDGNCCEHIFPIFGCASEDCDPSLQICIHDNTQTG